MPTPSPEDAAPPGPSRGSSAPGPTILVRRLDPGLPLPAYAHPGDAGADLVTAVDAEIPPGERAVLPTGMALALPDGHAAFVHPRSGLAARCGVALVNAPGTVDAGYRGEVRVVVVNLDPRQPVRLRRGDRIAQLVVQRVEWARFTEVEELPTSARGGGGFGSTGGHAGSTGGDAGSTGGDAGSTGAQAGEPPSTGHVHTSAQVGPTTASGPAAAEGK